VSDIPPNRGWIFSAGLVLALSLVLVSEYGALSTLRMLAGLGFLCALMILVGRIVLALAGHLRYLQPISILAFLYCSAYLAWSYSENRSTLLFLALVGAGTGLVIGLAFIAGQSRIGRRVENAESTFLKSIARRFSRDDNEA